MVERARELGIYRSLEGGVDLARPPADHLAGRFDVVTVAGVFTPGHVPPVAIAPVAATARPGGMVVASVRRRYLAETDFVDVEQQLCDDGVVDRILHREALPYAMDSTADCYVWRAPTA